MTPSPENTSAESPLEESQPTPSHNQSLTPAESAPLEKQGGKLRVINATLPQTRFIVDGINALIASDEDAQVVNVAGVVSVKISKPSYLKALLGLCKIDCTGDVTVSFILPEWMCYE